MVRITLLENTENGPVFEAYDLESDSYVPVKNWYEKSKDKWHIMFGPNSANRKYIAHNEFFAKAVDGVYLVEDKTTGPRVLGTAQPDRALVPFMTPEDKEKYDAIIARAIENRNAQKAVELSEVEKLQAKVTKLQAKLEAARAAKAQA